MTRIYSANHFTSDSHAVDLLILYLHNLINSMPPCHNKICRFVERAFRKRAFVSLLKVALCNRSKSFSRFTSHFRPPFLSKYIKLTFVSSHDLFSFHFFFWINICFDAKEHISLDYLSRLRTNVIFLCYYSKRFFIYSIADDQLRTL